jgi:hypothetical protein
MIHRDRSWSRSFAKETIEGSTDSFARHPKASPLVLDFADSSYRRPSELETGDRSPGIMHEIHAPVLSKAGWERDQATMQCDILLTPHPHAELQILQSIEPSHPFPIHPPAFARNNTQIRRCPNRGRAWARSRIRIRSADRSFAQLRRYQAARLNWARRQARRQLT